MVPSGTVLNVAGGAFGVCRVVLCACLLLFCGFDLRTAWGQGNAAVVTGADRLVVRRGPGKRYPPVAAITRGSKVEVQEMHGEWARVVTGRGERGYVKSTYLVLPAEKERRSVPAQAATPAAATPVEPQSAALQTATERNKTLEAELHSLRQELTELKSRPDPPPASNATPPAVATELHAELVRLAAAVEGLQRRVDARPVTERASPLATSATDGSSNPVPAIAVLFGMIGILIGWLIGGTYGRKQERGRRSRIRF